MPRKISKPRTVQPEYLTVREAQAICRYKWPETIRRAIYSGELPAYRLHGQKLLIKSKDFWKWFHTFKVKPTQVPEIDLFEPSEIEHPEEVANER